MLVESACSLLRTGIIGFVEFILAQETVQAASAMHRIVVFIIRLYVLACMPRRIALVANKAKRCIITSLEQANAVLALIKKR